MEMNPELWKQIPEFPDYEISNDGQVRRHGRIKTHSIDKKGYHTVSMWSQGKAFKRCIGPLVAAAFIGPKPAGLVVRHENGINSDNRHGNLEYGTNSENELDKRRHGTAPIGENHPAAKLTADQVSAIRRRYVKNSRTDGCNALGRDYGVTGAMICRIIHRVAWDHIP